MKPATKWYALALPVAFACSSNGDFTTGKNQDDGGPTSGGATGSGGSAGRSAGGTGARAAGGRSSGGALGTGGAVQCRTNADCPPLGCYMCSSFCDNGRCIMTVGGGTGGSAGSAGAGGVGGATSSLGVCPGAAPAPAGYPPCRTSADCPRTFDVCAHDPVGGCGVGPPPPECYADTDCTGGQVCLVITPIGCSGEGSHCIAPCTPTSCAADEACGTNGHCGPKPCTAGYLCATGTVCGPTRAAADAHGCAPASCATDGYQCPTDFRCAASSSADPHGCTAISCTEGYTCPENFDCNPSSTRLHQCDQRACTTDAECDCGACIQNRCEDRLFVCSTLPS